MKPILRKGRQKNLLLKTLLLSGLPLIGSLHFALKTANHLPLLLYPTMSLFTFILYADDKSRAKRQAWRIPENTLHLYELMGGWLGAYIAHQILRHKSSKRSYQIMFWAIVVLHMTFWLDWLLFGGSFSGMFFNYIIPR